MKKINLRLLIMIIVLLLMASSALLYLYYQQKNPLIGVWESKKWDSVLFIPDDRAPFYIEFTATTAGMYGQVAQAEYNLEQKEDKRVFLKLQRDNKEVELQIYLLDDDTIRFHLPGYGLRKYHRMNREQIALWKKSQANIKPQEEQKPNEKKEQNKESNN